MQPRLHESLHIDTMTPDEIVAVIQQQDQLVAPALAMAARNIARAIEEIAARLRDGGRLIYVGAGTSGRIAILDASEIPPTYGTSPELVQVIMAGGEKAFLEAVEGAEDDEEAAVAAVNARVRPQDAVVGIAASGSTPFTVTALRRANMLGALTVAVTSVSESLLAKECDIPIVVVTGPEVIMGSSRMKSGTAQKLILNTISTGVMVLLGKVYSNLMVEMPATNIKLRSRSVQMVELAAEVTRARAEQLFRDAGQDVKTAIVMARMSCDRDQAEQKLRTANGVLREALQS